MAAGTSAKKPRKPRPEREADEVVVIVELVPVPWTPEREIARREAVEAILAQGRNS